MTPPLQNFDRAKSKEELRIQREEEARIAVIRAEEARKDGVVNA